MVFPVCMIFLCLFVQHVSDTILKASFYDACYFASHLVPVNLYNLKNTKVQTLLCTPLHVGHQTWLVQLQLLRYLSQQLPQLTSQELTRSWNCCSPFPCISLNFFFFTFECIPKPYKCLLLYASFWTSAVGTTQRIPTSMPLRFLPLVQLMLRWSENNSNGEYYFQMLHWGMQ